MKRKPWDAIDAELADTLEDSPWRRQRRREAAEAVAAEPKATDCPDCGAQQSIPVHGRCSVCALSFEDLVEAHVFLERVKREAVADSRLPSPRAPSIPKDRRSR